MYGRSAYLETEVLTSSPERLVPMLYERLLVQLRRAQDQIRSGNIEGKADSLQKASAIVFELLGALDFEAGGELANRLASLYSYFAQRITHAGRAMDAAALDEVVRLATSLHESWIQAITRSVDLPGSEGS